MEVGGVSCSDTAHGQYSINRSFILNHDRLCHGSAVGCYHSFTFLPLAVIAQSVT